MLQIILLLAPAIFGILAIARGEMAISGGRKLVGKPARIVGVLMIIVPVVSIAVMIAMAVIMQASGASAFAVNVYPSITLMGFVVVTLIVVLAIAKPYAVSKYHREGSEINFDKLQAKPHKPDFSAINESSQREDSSPSEPS